MLTPFPSCIIHYNERHGNMTPFTPEGMARYYENKAPENQPENTINMWYNMHKAFQDAPPWYQCYVRMRYDIVMDAPVNFEDYPMECRTVYIPSGQDYRDGVNDQMAFGSHYAMTQYFAVIEDYPEHFAVGKMFHSESYLKYTLENRGINIVRIPQTNTIIR
jgi:hypothetical protein